MAVDRNNTEVFDHRREPYVKLRTGEFGAPLTRDNEPMNPGRMRYSALQSSSYSSIDAEKFYLYDTMGVQGTVPDIKSINRKSIWYSGPPANNVTSDHVSEHGGYWSSPGGRGCDWENYAGSGDSHYPVTLSMTNKSEDLKMLYNLGHGTRKSSSEGMEYNPYGISGYVTCYPDSEMDGSKASAGVQYMYLMTRMDRTEDMMDDAIDGLKDIISKLLAWLEEHFGPDVDPDDDDDSGRGPGLLPRPDRPGLRPNLFVEVGDIKTSIKEKLAGHNNNIADLITAINDGTHDDTPILKILRLYLNGGEDSFINQEFTAPGSKEAFKLSLELINDMYQLGNPDIATVDNYLGQLWEQYETNGKITGGQILMTLFKAYTGVEEHNMKSLEIGGGILALIDKMIGGEFDNKTQADFDISDDDWKFANVIKQLFENQTDTYDTSVVDEVHKNSPYIYTVDDDSNFHVSPRTIEAPNGSSTLFENYSGHQIQIWQTDDRIVNENSVFEVSETIDDETPKVVEITKDYFVFVCVTPGHDMKEGVQTTGITAYPATYFADDQAGNIPDWSLIPGRVSNTKLEKGLNYNFLNSLPSGADITILCTDDAQPDANTVFVERTLRPGAEVSFTAKHDYVYYSAKNTGITLAEYGTIGLQKPIICEENITPFSSTKGTRRGDEYEGFPITIYMIDGTEDNDDGVPDWEDGLIFGGKGVTVYSETSSGSLSVHNTEDYDITIHFGEVDDIDEYANDEDSYNSIDWKQEKLVRAGDRWNIPFSDQLAVVTRGEERGVPKYEWDPVNDVGEDVRVDITAWFATAPTVLPDWKKAKDNAITHMPLNKRMNYKFKLDRKTPFSVTLFFSSVSSNSPGKKHPFSEECHIVHPGDEVTFKPAGSYVYLSGHTVDMKKLEPKDWSEYGEYFSYKFRKSRPEGAPDIELPIGGGGNGNGGGGGKPDKPGKPGGGGKLYKFLAFISFMLGLEGLNQEGILDMPIYNSIKNFLGNLRDFGLFGALKEADFIFPLTEEEPNNEYRLGYGASVNSGWIKETWADNLQPRFFNLSVHPYSRLMIKAAGMRFNGVLVHATAGTGGAVITGDAIRQVQFEFVTPHYMFSVAKVRPNRSQDESGKLVPEFKKIFRHYDVNEQNERQTELGIETDKKIRLDQRVPYIEWETQTNDPTYYDKCWFNPQLSRCIIAKTQGTDRNRGGAKMNVGDMGARTDHRTKGTGMTTNNKGPGLYLDEMFRSAKGGLNLGAGYGSKYWNYYNTRDSVHNWCWECFQLDPDKWPLYRSITKWDGTILPPDLEYHEEIYPGMEFTLTNLDLNQKLNDATNDWQINKIHMNFVNPDGENKALKVYVQKQNLDQNKFNYVFRDTDSHGTPGTHVMAQLKEWESTTIRVFSDQKIDGNWRFWGFSVTAWCGNKAVAANWRAYTISNLKHIWSFANPL